MNDINYIDSHKLLTSFSELSQDDGLRNGIRCGGLYQSPLPHRQGHDRQHGLQGTLQNHRSHTVPVLYYRNCQ